ncbi:hypothetical protein Thi970DRAFT_03482 [Thiorhodovibrio frisius]|uniref:Toxin CptA n=2 Tax=Thiorhodovibrio frisius TaxID=631362 RepID=H8Z7M3_9GAMM|nr:hypothetical protein Thi970DRAFT_03482 [Thiorhodovibrio frisius]WPL20604.1 hypothetical protein Thiofri_00703 [Thiorhodovibrio frisius]
MLVVWTLLHLGAMAVIAALPLLWTFRVGLALLLGAHGYWSFATHFWRCLPWSIMQANRTCDAWELVLNTGEPVRARLLGSSFIGQRLMVLNFAVGGWRRLSLPLAGDSLDGELLRRLRVELREGL